MNKLTQHFSAPAHPGKRPVRRALVAAVMATGALVAPAASQAATAQVANVGTNGFLTYSAAAGEANNVIVSVSSGKLLIRDTAPISAGAGCEITAAGDALCRANVDGVSVALGDGNDVAQYLAPHAGGVFGQAGDDIINGGQRAAGPKGRLDLSGGDGTRDMITSSARPGSCRRWPRGRTPVRIMSSAGGRPSWRAPCRSGSSPMPWTTSSSLARPPRRRP